MISIGCGPNLAFAVGLQPIFVLPNRTWINLIWGVMLSDTSVADGALRWVCRSFFSVAIYLYRRCLLVCCQTSCFCWVIAAKLCFKCGFFCLSVQATINQLRAELAKGPQEVAVYVQELQKLQSSVKELEQKNQVRMLLFPLLVGSH